MTISLYQSCGDGACMHRTSYWKMCHGAMPLLVCSVEDAKPEAGMRPVPRAVIRLDNGVILTRIDPDRKETSMLFRTRPGWHKLRLWLEGQDGDSHRSVSVLASISNTAAFCPSYQVCFQNACIGSRRVPAIQDIAPEFCSFCKLCLRLGSGAAVEILIILFSTVLHFSMPCWLIWL